MKYWEYKIEGNIREPELNKLGAEGWELVSVVVLSTNYGGHYSFFFKRLLK